MSHPGIDGLTAWVYELLAPEEACAMAAHVSDCPDCRETADRLREESRAIAGEIAPEGRLASLKERLLRQAEAGPAGKPRFASRGLLWQIPVAAAVLVGLVVVLATSSPNHHLLAGRLALENGREIAAPADLAGSSVWRLHVLEKAVLQLADQSTVDLEPGSGIGLEACGDRGVQAQLTSGEAMFVVRPDPRRLTVGSPAGRVECTEGKFFVKIVFDNPEGGEPMKGMITGTLVTLLAGSASIANAQGQAMVQPGQVAALSTSEAPLLVASPQDADGLLKRLEQLAARVSKLEDEIGRLEAKNKQLKDQLKAGGGGWFGGPGGSVRVNLAPGAANPGAPVIIELEEKLERAQEKK